MNTFNAPSRSITPTGSSVSRPLSDWIGGAARRTLIVAGRGYLAENLQGGAADAGNTNADSRIPVRNGPVASSNIRLVFGNFYATAGADVDGANAILLRAAIEVWGGALLTIPVTFNGQLSISIDPKASLVISDPVGISLNPNELFAVRCNAQVAADGQFPVGNINCDDTIIPGNGDVNAFSGNMLRNALATVVYSTGMPAGSAVTGFSHMAVLGETLSVMPSFVIYGDSIAKGSGDSTVTDISSGGGTGFIVRGLHLDNGVMLPNANLARAGSNISVWGSGFNGNDVHRRVALFDYATWAICAGGTNDIAGGATFAQMKDRYNAAWGLAKKRGLKVAQTKIIPRVTGTYTTPGGQTVVTGFSVGGVRDQINAWMGAQVGQGLLDAVIDPNPYVEDPANPSKWKTADGAFTADGTHPNAAGHIAAAAAVRAWASTLGF